MILVLLQNAWSTWYTRIGRPGEEIHRLKDRVWHRDDWLAATWASRSGRNLAKMLADVPQEDLWLDDTTLEIADTPAGIRPTDQAHVDALLSRQPRLVIACGKQAEYAVTGWLGPLIIMPHPAYRVLNNATLQAARETIASGLPARCRLKPTRDGFYALSSLIIDHQTECCP